MHKSHQSTEMQPLSGIVETRSGMTARVLARAERLATLTEALRAMGAPWSPALRVANLRDGTAVLYAEHAAAASRARLDAQAIANCLARHGALVKRLEIKVRPLLVR